MPLLGADCDPLVPQHCGLPFPSNVWLVDGKVTFGATTLPARANQAPIDGTLFTDKDGFSAAQTAIVFLPGAVDDGLPTPDTIPASLAPDSPTILMDADTGERVPHFVDLDVSARSDDERSILIRPVMRLADAKRYIVALRHVKNGDGKEIAPSPVFQALRDGTPNDDASVRRRRDLYADIFGRLEAHGVPRNDLQIAWDYTTASRANTTRALLAMRDDALQKVGADGPEYVITSVEDKPNTHTLQRLHGMMTVPLYLDKPDTGAHLFLGPDGLPKQNGTADFSFTVIIPNSASTGEPLAIIQNGHGLLGKQSEGQDGYLAEFCDRFRYVSIAVDFVGFAHEDEDTAVHAISDDIRLFRALIDRQHQGLVNSLLAMRMMKGRFTRDPHVQIGGKSVIDPTRAYYRGDSQGGIYGGTYMSISTDVTRGLLGEPGMPYNLLLDRSADFSGYKFFLRANFPNAIDTQILQGLTQLWWDRTEPTGWVPYIRTDMHPGTPSHEVLIHVAIGDHQVPPLGAHVIARTIGAKNLKPLNRDVFGIDGADGPISGSAMVEYSFGLPPAPLQNYPPQGSDDDDPHDKVRGLDPSYEQSDKFFRDGVIVPFCDGPCDPT
jgi:hypothetical protein